ncbi:MAG: hypothetical protein BA870_11650 [Desulfuromonadales bacterium C00003094]|nr:MAG: hypothetical protein BA870_11650 [Desulfuromonadales bacterium C00003094]OEU74705.1 MAG: hypothetical protein BA869_06420 [Desulfuromonadales bacterium C00003107]
MVIQCPHCQACFKLPQNKVKPGGTKVRCTKCKIIFMVTPPQDDVLTEDASADASAKGFGEENALDKELDSADFFTDGDEGDEFLLGETTFEDDDDDFLAVDGAEFEEQSDLDWSDDSDLSPLIPDSEQAGEISFADELLYGDPGEPQTAEPPAQEVPLEVSLTLAEEDEPEIDEADSGLPEEDLFFDEGSSRVSLPAPRPPAERRKQSYWGWMWLLVLLLLIAGGGYVYHARQQLTASWQKLLVDWQLIPAPPAEGKELKPVSLTGYVLNNQREGRLFIIQGQVLNEGAEPRATIVVQGRVYDAKGVQLAQQRAFCGNPMGKEQLRVWPLMRMTERMQNQFGEMLANLNLEPQRAIPFTLVFKDLPGEVVAFDVIVEASEPVIK